MKTLIMTAILIAVAPVASVTAQTPAAVAQDRLVDVQMSTGSRDGPPTGVTSVSIVPGKVYVPPAGHSVAYTCSSECSYWLVENDTFYDTAVYSAKVAWMSAIALLGLLVCLGLLLGMFALGRDVVRRNGKDTVKVLNEIV